jgi:hypothetical protein
MRVLQGSIAQQMKSPPFALASSLPKGETKTGGEKKTALTTARSEPLYKSCLKRSASSQQDTDSPGSDSDDDFFATEKEPSVERSVLRHFEKSTSADGLGGANSQRYRPAFRLRISDGKLHKVPPPSPFLPILDNYASDARFFSYYKQRAHGQLALKHAHPFAFRSNDFTESTSLRRTVSFSEQEPQILETFSPGEYDRSRARAKFPTVQRLPVRRRHSVSTTSASYGAYDGMRSCVPVGQRGNHRAGAANCCVLHNDTCSTFAVHDDTN